MDAADRSRVTFVTTKATVLGPRPFGGTLTAEISDPVLARAANVEGAIITRAWHVYERADGTRFSETFVGPAR